MMLSASKLIKDELKKKRGRNLDETALEVRGAFLECGSASVKSGYRLEFACKDAYTADRLNDILIAAQINSKRAARGGKEITYVKGIDAVSDLLALMGANLAVLELNNEYAERQLNTEANRVKNCDLANIDKSLGAAERQSEAIKKLIESGKLDGADERLYETAMARLEYPDLSLKELAEKLGISKSGVRHRLNKIIGLAGP